MTRGTFDGELTASQLEALALITESVRTWLPRQFHIPDDIAAQLASDAAVYGHEKFGGVPSILDAGRYAEFKLSVSGFARSRALNYLRAEGRARRREAAWQEALLQPSTPMDDLLRKELEHFIAHALGELPDESRVAFLMQSDGAPLQEIADTLGVTVRRARYVITKATSRLADCIRDFMEDRLPPDYPGFLSLRGASPRPETRNA